MSEKSREGSQVLDPGLGEHKEEPQGESESLETPSSLRDTGPLQGENSTDSQASSLESQVSQKTQGVRVPRAGGAQILQDAAKKAARSNSRNDVAEYMRIRRSYV